MPPPPSAVPARGCDGVPAQGWCCRGSEGRGGHLHALFQQARFVAFAAEFYAGEERRQQLAVVPRLGDEVRGAALQCTYRLVGIGIGRHHDDHRLRVAVQDVFQPLEAFLAADGIAPEVHIQQYHVGTEQVHEPVRLLRLRRHAEVLHQRLQQQVQREEDVLVVVNDEYLSFLFHRRMLAAMSCKLGTKIDRILQISPAEADLFSAASHDGAILCGNAHPRALPHHKFEAVIRLFMP